MSPVARQANSGKLGGQKPDSSLELPLTQIGDFENAHPSQSLAWEEHVPTGETLLLKLLLLRNQNQNEDKQQQNTYNKPWPTQMTKSNSTCNCSSRTQRYYNTKYTKKKL